MIIKDKNEKILAVIVKPQEIKDEKYFATENDFELQLASFDLAQGKEIQRHYHPEQKREINLTSEIIIVTKGEIEVEIYDDDLDLSSIQIIKEGEVVALYRGGHKISILKDSKFIEVKQGPYDPDTDKKHF